MILQELTTAAGILAILQSLLLLCWDCFFLFVCYRPGVFSYEDGPWLNFYYDMVGDILLAINGIAIVSSLLNFIWFLSSILALISNAFARVNAVGLRVWIAVTVAIVFSDIAFTVFIIFSTTMVFEDLFRDEKHFIPSNSTRLIEFGEGDIRNSTIFGNDVLYKGYTWLLAGVSRGFLVTVIINIVLIVVVYKRSQEIRLGPTKKLLRRETRETETNFYIDDLQVRRPDSGHYNNGFISPAAPNMYSESNPVEERSVPVFNTFKSEDTMYTVPNRFKLSERPSRISLRDSERRPSARNYALNIDAIASPIMRSEMPVLVQSTTPIRLSLPPRNSKFSEQLPEIPEPDYDVPIRANARAPQDNIRAVSNPLYETGWPQQNPNRANISSQGYQSSSRPRSNQFS